MTSRTDDEPLWSDSAGFRADTSSHHIECDDTETDPATCPCRDRTTTSVEDIITKPVRKRG